MNFVSKVIQFVVFAYFEDEKKYKFLLFKRSPEREVYPNIWQICTGRRDAGETGLKTAMRELWEETGLNKFKKIWTVPNVPVFYDVKNDVFSFSPVFAAEIEEGTEIILSDEHTEYGWFEMDGAIGITSIPSYHQAIKVTMDYIINSKEADLFRIEIENDD